MAYHVCYKLNEDFSVSPCDVTEMPRDEFRSAPFKVAHSKLRDFDVQISTVFLGINHNFEPGPPLVFETMVFAKDYPDIDEYMDRYSTWDDAVAGHEAIWQKVQSHLLDQSIAIEP